MYTTIVVSFPHRFQNVLFNDFEFEPFTLSDCYVSVQYFRKQYFPKPIRIHTNNVDKVSDRFTNLFYLCSEQFEIDLETFIELVRGDAILYNYNHKCYHDAIRKKI